MKTCKSKPDFVWTPIFPLQINIVWSEKRNRYETEVLKKVLDENPPADGNQTA